MAASELATTTPLQARRRTPAEGLGSAVSVLWRYPIIPGLIWGTVLLFAVAAPWIAPHPPARQTLTDRLTPPVWQEGGTWTYPLGTDHLGRDVFSRIVYGSRVTAIVVALTVVGAASIGTFVGMAAGYFGGFVDALLMRLVDFTIALPALLFGVMLAAVLQPGLRNVVVIIILFTWAGFARLVRAEVLSLRNRDFIMLARVAGLSWPRIFIRHLFPNVLNTVMVLATLYVSIVIIFEASLSFLGLGIVPPTVSWGAMLSEGRGFMSVAGWLVMLPGLAIFVVALAGNLFGDWLRDTIDPHLRRAG
jgi:peptide/nickel transport system permease protein